MKTIRKCGEEDIPLNLNDNEFKELGLVMHDDQSFCRIFSKNEGEFHKERFLYKDERFIRAPLGESQEIIAEPRTMIINLVTFASARPVSLIFEGANLVVGERIEKVFAAKITNFRRSGDTFFFECEKIDFELLGGNRVYFKY